MLKCFLLCNSDHATNSPHIEIHNATKVVSVIGTKDFSVDIDYFQQARNSSIVNPGGNTYDPNTPGVLFTVACVNFGPSLFSPSVGEANVIITDINPDCVISSTQPLVNSVLQVCLPYLLSIKSSLSFLFSSSLIANPLQPPDLHREQCH